MDAAADPERQASLAARAGRRAAAVAAGLDDAFVDRLVETFYGRIREDCLLGPIFADRVGDWPTHLGRMKAFWRTVLHASGEYDGRPMPAHVAIPGLGPVHFQRWLALFERTLADIGPGGAGADHVAGKARNIAQSLLTGVAVHRHGIAGARAGDALRRA